MLRIALCDDDQIFLSKLREKIKHWFQSGIDLDYRVSYREFSSSKELSQSLNGDFYDILFLDIEMPELDGMLLAKEVREKLPWAIIIFLTSHEEFASDGYHVQALRYLSKQQIDSQLDEALRASIKAFEQLEVGTLDVTSYGKINRIAYRDILYIRHQLRYSQIATTSQGMIQDSRGIKALYEVIGNERFVFIDRGTFINLDHLQRIEDGKAILRNGEALTISRRILPHVKKAINTILGG